MRRTGAALAMVVACLLGAGAWTAPALASPPKGKLTSEEYKLLSSYQAAGNASSSGSNVNWSKAQTACRLLGSSTPLLKAQRVSCQADLKFLQYLIVNFAAALDKYDKKSLTLADYAHLAPAYATLATDAQKMYAADQADAKAVNARGLTGKCLAYLAGTPKELSEESAMASATKKLSNDMTLALRVVQGKEPVSAISVSQVSADATAFGQTSDTWLDAAGSGPSKPSVCPHQ